ncbi:hypothetical protein DEA8626_04134 [Defluviimonas aquaemixtae]|uniref:Rhamnosyl transferase n=1 Tax=Albidovulum aquaemixtae TaxID=1542388 RepID=A0A2R8BNS2_9RHOB|nr:glycosyltransferase [Defluviimonas aquaemixtae]SPH25098.1 hypothetical protein DEA8626_04134 [Defluviimonas aquaemixtae]
MKIRVLGVCRFSLLVTDGFQTMPAVLADRRATLFDPARLAVRFHWFEHVLLPSVRAQSDPDFTLLVVTSDDLPEPFLARLCDLIAPVPQLELVQAPPLPHGVACSSALRARMDPEADVVAEFRLDDDDAVAFDYVRRVRSDFREYLAPLYEKRALVALDHCKGFVLTGIDGKADLHTVAAHLWTPALTLYMPPGHDRSLFDYPHHLLFRRMSVLSLQDSVMYVRGVHGFNDSGVAKRHLSEPIESGRARDWIANRFGIDLDAFSLGLGALHESAK